MDSDQSVEEDWPDYYADPVGHCVYGLRHGNEMERCNAGDILRGLAGDAEPALPVIVEFMRSDASDQVRAGCAFALCDIGYVLGERARPAIGPLREALLGDPFAEVRSLAATALGSIGPAAREAIPALTAALQDEHEWVREAAREALNPLYGVTRASSPGKSVTEETGDIGNTV